MEVHLMEIATILGPKGCLNKTSGEVRQPPPPFPGIALSPHARAILEDARAWLASRPIEHWLGFHLSEAGEIVGLSQFSGDATSCQIPFGVLMAESHAFGGAALAALHNHPNGAPAPSAHDQATSNLLRQRLARDGKLLFADEIVPARVEPLREAAPRMETLWDIEQCEAARLWACYPGGKPPW